MEESDLYKDYRHERYIHYRQVRTGKFISEEVKGKDVRMKPVLEQRKIPFEEIKSLRLDMYGTLTPQLDTEDFTLVSNYLLDFWGACIGNDAVQVYLHLKRYAYGKKDFCFPDIEMIALKMGKSRNTIKKYLNILEEHHFIAIFLRRDATDNNRDVSPFFKIRRFIPLITSEMYESLHPKLKAGHDRFMKAYQELQLTNELTEKNAIVNEMVIEKELLANKKQMERIQAMIQEGKKYDYIRKNISEESLEATDIFLEVVKRKVSKPSFDTWISQLLFIRSSEDRWTVACPNEFAKDWLEMKYEQLFHQWFSSEASDYFNPNDQFSFRIIDDILTKQ